MRVGASSRVPATTDFLWLTARQDEVALERVILRVADPREYLADPAKGHAALEHLNAALEADELTVTIVDGKRQLCPRSASGAIVAAVIAKTALLDFDTVQRDIARCKAPPMIQRMRSPPHARSLSPFAVRS